MLRKESDIVSITKYVAGVSPEDMSALYQLFQPQSEYPWLEITLKDFDGEPVKLWSIVVNEYAEYDLNNNYSFTFSEEFMNLVIDVIGAGGYDNIYFEVDE